MRQGKLWIHFFHIRETLRFGKFRGVLSFDEIAVPAFLTVWESMKLFMNYFSNMGRRYTTKVLLLTSMGTVSIDRPPPFPKPIFCCFLD